jgi:aspartate aminotransferase
MNDNLLNGNVTSIVEEGAFAVLENVLRAQAEGHDVINLGIGQPDLLPPQHALEAAARAAREGPHGYTSSLGVAPLREAVAADVAARTGMSVTADEVVIAPGGKVTIFLAATLFGGAGTEILYPDPGFPAYREAARMSGAVAIPYPVKAERGFSFNADDVLGLINERTRLIILNSPANPTGGVVERAELDRLAEGLLRHPHVAVLTDEIYSQLVFDGSEFASFFRYPELQDRTILLDGWSKTFAMTGWRLGYGVWPKGLIPHVRKLVSTSYSCVNVAAQLGGLAALTGPRSDVEAYRAKLKERRDAVVAGLNAIPGISCQVPGGAFYVFPDVTGTGWSSQAFAQMLLDQAHVAVIAGESFGENGAGFVRISYATELDRLLEAIDRIKVFLETYPVLGRAGNFS